MSHDIVGAAPVGIMYLLPEQIYGNISGGRWHKEKDERLLALGTINTVVNLTSNLRDGLTAVISMPQSEDLIIRVEWDDHQFLGRGYGVFFHGEDEKIEPCVREFIKYAGIPTHVHETCHIQGREMVEKILKEKGKSVHYSNTIINRVG